MMNAREIYDFLHQYYSNVVSCAIMGNLYTESGLKSTNLQNSYEKSLGYTDDSYTQAVDNNVYNNFVYDSAGYGLAQWTYWSRKQNLYNYMKTNGKSIGDCEYQLRFLISELESNYKTCLSNMKKSDVAGATEYFMKSYENPADQSNTAIATRVKYAQDYYNSYSDERFVVGNNYKCLYNINVRSGPGTNYSIKKWSELTADGQKHDADKNGSLDAGTVVTCKAVTKDSAGNTWIQIPSGYICGVYQGTVYLVNA